jgi:hypothetical protein
MGSKDRIHGLIKEIAMEVLRFIRGNELPSDDGESSSGLPMGRSAAGAVDLGLAILTGRPGDSPIVSNHPRRATAVPRARGR